MQPPLQQDPNAPHPLESMTEAMILQNEEIKGNTEETNALLGALIAQGESDNDVLLEAQIENDKQIGDKIVEAVKESNKNTLNLELDGVELATLKGETGEKGDKGDKGDTGPQGESIKGDKGDTGEQGPAGLDGRDGVDGIGIKGDKGDKGDRGTDGINGSDGRDGKNGSEDTPKQIKKKLESLKDDDRLDIKALKGVDEMNKRIKKAGDFVQTYQQYDVNGTLVGNGTRLNLKQGTGVTLSGVPTSNGVDVTINASGGGAVDSVNGQTGVVVLDAGDISGFATVATTGSYNDLSDKPTIPTGTIDGTLTTNELVYSVDANTVGSLAVATYPSLAELAHVKGVTSAIQTQLNGKEPTKGADDNYVTDAQLVVIGNTSGTNSGNQTLTNSSDATSHTVTLSASGGSVQLIEGSGVTLTTGGTGSVGTVTIAASGGSGATTALDNLASVAINTTLVSDTDNTDDLGTTLKKWANLFVTTIGATATRVTKGWFTDIESTNIPTVNGNTLASALNLSGTNTGDNATNSQYSGLVTNATHTGDATGSGALTVVAINGTNMAGLATGILKNTTTTGAPSIAVAGDFPTLNQSTTGSAATLTTTRAIYGNNFDGSAALTQVIASTYGGTGNGFTKIVGPTTTEKTITIPDANMTITAAAATVLDDTTVGAMVDTLGGASSTGTGGLVRATSPTLVTPALGTPSSGNLSNCTGIPAPSGIGWALKSYTTATTASSITISSLDLATDIKYKIVVMCVPTGGTNTGVSFRVNAASSGYLNYNNVAGADGTTATTLVNDGNTTTAYGLVKDENGTYLHDFEMNFLVQPVNGSTTMVVWWGDGGAWNTTERSVFHFSGMSTETNMTSIAIGTLLNNSNTCNWKVWVYRLATS